MKVMTCKQLGGACTMSFRADDFEDMMELSKKHGALMYKKGDRPHQNAMEKMMEIMKEPNGMSDWLKKKEELFDSLPED